MKSLINKGIWINTKDEENEIKLWCSTFTGKEITYLNDKVTSTKRTFFMKSKHKFKDSKGTNYEFRISVANLFKAELECSLSKNGTLIKEFNVKRQKQKYYYLKQLGLVFLLVFILSTIGIIIKNNFNYKIDTIYIMIILFFALHMFNNKCNQVVVHEKLIKPEQ